MAPKGLLYNEVTAATLLKVDMAGEVVDPGSTGLGPNQPAFTLHAAIHAARPDIKCIIHLRNPAAISVSLGVLITIMGAYMLDTHSLYMLMNSQWAFFHKIHFKTFHTLDFILT